MLAVPIMTGSVTGCSAGHSTRKLADGPRRGPPSAAYVPPLAVLGPVLARVVAIRQAAKPDHRAA
ncbi:MAG TPA: hypothetical protein VKP69_08535 [Isosphaeraceae bacterium]|nr:hypothetical protein [Isosphaeraceae bacterium]